MSSSNATRTVRGVLTSSLYEYQDFVLQVLDALVELGWQEADVFGVHMALEESISNAIRHGNKEDLTKKVHVECQLSPHRFWAQIRDEGAGYEPASIPDCRSLECLEEPGGRGLALIRAYMTSVDHGDCGNCLTMEKDLRKTTSQGPSKS